MPAPSRRRGKQRAAPVPPTLPVLAGPSAVELAAIALTLGFTLKSGDVVAARVVGDDDSVTWRVNCDDGAILAEEELDEYSHPRGAYWALSGWERKTTRTPDFTAFGAARAFTDAVGEDATIAAVRAARAAG
ncbi:MAG: hypothetical protein HOW73_47830 [Polyangiaceae bacterium]|nr:hypothetical protein [Polyangiaceae bacterium]